MDVRQLNQFISVATCGSFSRAATEIRVSQPAITRSVQLLEEELGVKLFIRGSKGVKMTRDGETLLRHAKLAVNVLDAAREAILAAREKRARYVRIGTANLFNEFALPEAVSALTARHSDLRCLVRVGLFEDLLEQLRAGELDAILTTEAGVGDDQDLAFEKLGEIESCVMAGRLVNASALKTIEDLRQARWVTLDHAHTDTFLTSFFAKHSLTAPESVVRASSLGLLRNLIRSSDMIGWLPIDWIREDLAQGNFAKVEIPGLSIRRAYGVVTRHLSLKDPLVQLFLDALKDFDGSDLPPSHNAD